MRTHKSGILGLALGMAVLAACEQKAPIVNIPPTPTPPATVSLKIVPGSLSLTPGSSQQLTAVVTGSATQTATWTSSNSLVTVNPASGATTTVSVAATVPVGTTATITAVSTADATARDAILVTVVAGGGTVGGGQVTIQSVTQGGTIFPVQINNVQGQIDITLNVDLPPGTPAGTRLVTSIIGPNDTTRVRQVCDQTLTTGTSTAEGIDAAAVPVTVVCSVNTAGYDSTGVSGSTVHFPNGTYIIRSQIVGPGGDPIATSVNQTYIFNNQNFINAALSYSRSCALAGNDPASIGGAGSLWCGGDVIVGLRPVIYTRAAGLVNDSVAQVFVSLTTSGVGSNGICAGIDAGGPTAFPDCAPVTVTLRDSVPGDLQVNFDDAVSVTATTPGSLNIEDIITINVNSVTRGGQAGPTCINPDVARNAFNIGRLGFSGCGTGAPGFTAPNVAFYPQPQRLDNFGPRALVFALPGANEFAASNQDRYLDAGFTFAGAAATSPTGTATTSGGAVRGTGVIQNDVDYGVDRQNANLHACPSNLAVSGGCTFFRVTLANGTTDTVATGAGIDSLSTETETNNVLFVSAVLIDALGNVATYYPNVTPAAPIRNPSAAALAASTPGLAGSPQRVGLDVTAPTITATHTDGTCAIMAAGGATTPAAGNCVYPDDDNLAPNTPSDMWTFIFQDLSGDAGSGPSGFFVNPVRAWQTRTAAGTTTNVFGTSTAGVTPPAPNTPTSVLVTNGSSVEGYYRTRANVRDAAFNLSNEFNGLVLLDYTAPTMGGIGSQSTIRGFEDVPFTADLQDNVELGDLAVYIGYAGSGYDLVHRPAAQAGATVSAEARLVYGAYGDDATPFASAAPVQVTRFIRSVETTDPATNRPSAAACPNTNPNTACAGVFPASDVNYLLRDVAGLTLQDVCPPAGAADNSITLNCRLRSLNIASNVAQGLGNEAAPAFAHLAFNSANVFGAGTQGVFYMRSNTNPFTGAPVSSTVCNRPAAQAGCTNPRSVTLTATVNGPQASFAQPFAEVRFYARDPQGREILIGVATTTFSIDDTVLNERRWVYQIVWTPTLLVPAAYPVFAVGVHTSGSALVTQDGQVITVATS